eukprot:g32176.t1
MAVAGIRTDMVSYVSGIGPSSEESQWKQCALLFQDTASQWRLGLSLASDLHTENLLNPDIVLWNTVVATCMEGSHWSLSLQVMKDMPKSKVDPDVVTVNTAANACAKAAEWQHGLDLLDQMTQGDVCPDALTYTALIGTCQQDEQWQLALTLLQQMLQEKLVKWSAQL